MKPDFNYRKVDAMIAERLAIRKIVLSEFNSDFSKIEDIKEYGKHEIHNRHSFTILNFWRYCLIPFKEIFIAKPALKESTDYIMLYLILEGYIEGVNSLNDELQSNKLFEEAIPSLFHPFELKDIGAHVKALITGFPTQVEETYEWMEKHIIAEKEQIEPVMNFLSLLAKYKDDPQGTNRPELKEAAKEVTESAFGKNRHTFNHNLVALNAFERSGMDELIPVKSFLLNITRIFNYLDVLHYGGYVNINGDSNNPNDIIFC